MIETLLDRIINSHPAELAAVVFFSVIAMTLKEYVKALTASKLGDTSGEVSTTLANPFSKISISGILMALISLVSWSRSTEIRPGSFTNRRKGMLLSGFSGLSAVLILGVIYALLIRFTFSAGKDTLTETLLVGLYVNIYFFWFNLLPAPQLDGALIFGAFLPRSADLLSDKYKTGFLIAFFVIYFSGNMYFLMIPANMIINLILSLVFR